MTKGSVLDGVLGAMPTLAVGMFPAGGQTFLYALKDRQECLSS